MRNRLIIVSLYVILILLGLYAVFDGRRMAWLLFAGYIGLVTYETIVWMSLQTSFHVVRTLSEISVTAGTSLSIHAQAKSNRKIWGVSSIIHVEDVVPHGLEKSVMLTAHWVKAARKDPLNEWNRWHDRYELCEVERGLYDFTAIMIISGDVFGLLHKREFIPCHTRIVVYPAVRMISRWDVFEKMMRRASTQNLLDIGTAGRVIATRAYEPGDRMHRIHWLATARMDELRVKELEWMQRLVLSLVLHAPVPSEFTIAESSRLDFELAISIVATIGQFALPRRIEVCYYEMGQPAFAVYRGAQMQTNMSFFTDLAVSTPKSSIDSSVWHILNGLKGTIYIVVTTALNEFYQDVMREGITWPQSTLILSICQSDHERTEMEEHIIMSWSARGWKVAMIHSLDQFVDECLRR